MSMDLLLYVGMLVPDLAVGAKGGYVTRRPFTFGIRALSAAFLREASVIIVLSGLAYQPPRTPAASPVAEVKWRRS